MNKKYKLIDEEGNEKNLTVYPVSNNEADGVKRLFLVIKTSDYRLEQLRMIELRALKPTFKDDSDNLEELLSELLSGLSQD